MRLALLLAALALVALVPAGQAADLPCATLGTANACPVLSTEWGMQGGVIVWGDGFYADALVQQGVGFDGNYVYVVPLVVVDGVAAVHAGLGMADRDYDGDYEDAMVGGALQTVVYVPFGVGVYDADEDGQTDSVYHEPQLG